MARAMLAVTSSAATPCRAAFSLSTTKRAFGWSAAEVDGHDVEALAAAIGAAQTGDFPGPRAVIAQTVKGKGAPSLEGDPLCHVRTLTPQEVEELTGGAP